MNAPTERLADLRAQYREWERSGYDGHGRKSGDKKAAIKRRRARRRANRRVRAWVA